MRICQSFIALREAAGMGSSLLVITAPLSAVVIAVQIRSL